MTYYLSQKTKSELNKLKIYFLLLTKDEEKSIGEVLSNLKEICKKLEIQKFQILLADDSTDNTKKIAEKNEVQVVQCGNKGLGNAFNIGIHECVKQGADLIFTVDADGQVDLEEIALFLDALIIDNADMVIGSRFLEGTHVKYKYPIINRFGTLLLSSYLTILTGQKITDSHGGIRLMKSIVAKDLKIWGNHTYVQEAIIEASTHGYKILEVPSLWKERTYGSSRVLKSKFKYIKATSPILIKRALVAVKKKFDELI